MDVHCPRKLHSLWSQMICICPGRIYNILPLEMVIAAWQSVLKPDFLRTKRHDIALGTTGPIAAGAKESPTAYSSHFSGFRGTQTAHQPDRLHSQSLLLASTPKGPKAAGCVVKLPIINWKMVELWGFFTGVLMGYNGITIGAFCEFITNNISDIAYLGTTGLMTLTPERIQNEEKTTGTWFNELFGWCLSHIGTRNDQKRWELIPRSAGNVWVGGWLQPLQGG